MKFATAAALIAALSLFVASPSLAAEASAPPELPRLDAPTAPAAPLATKAPATAHVIERGERIDLALKRWADKAGWAVQWMPGVSWECPRRVEFTGDFVETATQVILALNQDGKRLRLRVYDNGQYMEVVQDGPQ